MHDSSIGSYVVGLSCLALVSCSLLIHTSERQCKSDADCADSKIGTSCVEQVCVSKPTCTGEACSVENAAATQGPCMIDKDCTGADAPRCLIKTCVSTETAEQWVCTDDQTVKPATIRYGFHVVDFLSREPPGNVVVKACRTNDIDCTEPVATFVDTDKTGHAQFDLPTGFFGFFDVRSDALATILYVTKPIVRNTLNRDLPVVTPDTVALLASLIEYKFDSTKGIALLEALDCSDTPAGGIQFKMAESTTAQFYLVDQIPSRDAMVSAYDSTNDTANGGFINIAPGFVSFSARLGVDGLELGSFNARIRPNTVTFLDMHF
jgi:hypothetical protein